MMSNRNAAFVREQASYVRIALGSIHKLDLLFKGLEEFERADESLTEAVLDLTKLEAAIVQIELEYSNTFDGENLFEYRHKSGK
jgi:hypothetical protein